MRAIPLAVPTMAVLAATAMLSGCAARNPGIESAGGDVFTLQTTGTSGSRAVEAGLAQAADFCAEYGRQFALTNSRVSSGSYQLEFRCLTGRNLPPIVQAAAAPPPPNPTRGRRGRNSTAAYTGEDVVETRRGTARMRRPVMAEQSQPVAYAPLLPPVMAPAQVFGQPVFAQPVFTQPAPSIFTPARTVAPALPPVATTPLFAPPPGVILPATPISGPRLPPIDNAPMVAIPRADDVTPVSTMAMVAPVAPARMAPAQQQRLPNVDSTPLLQSQTAAAAPMAQNMPAGRSLPMAESVMPMQAALPAQGRAPMPPIQVGVPSALTTPPPSFMVPSAQPLPGATSSLPPIAGGSTRPVPLPGNTSTGFSSPPGFWTGGR